MIVMDEKEEIKNEKRWLWGKILNWRLSQVKLARFVEFETHTGTSVPVPTTYNVRRYDIQCATSDIYVLLTSVHHTST